MGCILSIIIELTTTVIYGDLIDQGLLHDVLSARCAWVKILSWAREVLYSNLVVLDVEKEGH